MNDPIGSAAESSSALDHLSGLGEADCLQPFPGVVVIIAEFTGHRSADIVAKKEQRSNPLVVDCPVIVDCCDSGDLQGVGLVLVQRRQELKQ